MLPRRPASDGVLPIEIELRQEKAFALRRVANKLEKLLEELAQLERELPSHSGPARAKRVAEHRQLRAEAEKQQWYLIVQREALGLWNHADVYALYPIPPKVQ